MLEKHLLQAKSVNTKKRWSTILYRLIDVQIRIVGASPGCGSYAEKYFV